MERLRRGRSELMTMNEQRLNYVSNKATWSVLDTSTRTGPSQDPNNILGYQRPVVTMWFIGMLHTRAVKPATQTENRIPDTRHVSHRLVGQDVSQCKSRPFRMAARLAGLRAPAFGLGTTFHARPTTSRRDNTVFHFTNQTSLPSSSSIAPNRTFSAKLP